eukprot:scaffold53036_cov63-Phaeocystis_antarctica.AAC.2
METKFNRLQQHVAATDVFRVTTVEVQQTVAMLEHIGKSAAAIVKLAEYIDQWSGIVFEDQRA